ncbi:hypothetical protein CFC21_028836 [Triticum aestivum]|uniref:Bifunctional inhibitor/plant lipid transfer protein/seed storage helical domain-containing protein n=2 Tax=Triticum aestivum TaxID=4565 RepID=A0A9R1ERG1_WHEAT|nr:uncharacterized protein LOC123167225 [Triticum aestivum]KAF7014909.1 hypothetical protein CFC21_028836 [Triticum aestivum]
MIHRGRENKPVLFFLLLLVVSLLLVLDVAGESPPAAGGGGEPTTACGSSSYNYLGALLRLMIPCKAAVAPFSPAPPTEECCRAVRELGQPCLCLLLAGPPISGADRRMLTRLPSICADADDDESDLRQDVGSCTAT